MYRTRLSLHARVRIISFLLAAVLTLTGFLSRHIRAEQQYRTTLEYSYHRALDDLVTHTRSLSMALSRAQYANTLTMQNSLAATLLSSSGAAKASLAVLPFAQADMHEIDRFYARCGEYAQTLAKLSSAGQTVDEEALASLTTMGQYAFRLWQALSIADETIMLDGLTIGAAARTLANISADPQPTFEESFVSLSEDFASYPMLLYDGAFSDHMEKRSPALLAGCEEVSEEKARRNAAAFLSIPAEQLTGSGRQEGNLPAYRFTYDGGQILMSVCGGKVVRFVTDVPPAEEFSLTYAQAVPYAKDFLAAHGYENCTERYYTMNGSTCVISLFAAQQAAFGPVLCYADLIRVTVSLADGKILAMDATDFVKNHWERSLSAPTLSPEQAAQQISRALSPTQSGLCLLPSDGGNDVLCYEFTCTGTQGETVLVYVNAESGLEEKIALLVSNADAVYREE